MGSTTSAIPVLPTQALLACDEFACDTAARRTPDEAGRFESKGFLSTAKGGPESKMLLQTTCGRLPLSNVGSSVGADVACPKSPLMVPASSYTLKAIAFRESVCGGPMVQQEGSGSVHCEAECLANLDYHELESGGACEQISDIRAATDEIRRLRRSLAEAEGRASQAEVRLGMWESMMSFASYVVGLGPDRGDSHRRTLMKELRKAILSVELVQQVEELSFSLPTVSSEAPRLTLVQWGGDFLQPILVDVQWMSASWHLDVSVSGRHFGIGFSMKLQAHHFSLKGRLKVVLPGGQTLDLSQARVSFVSFPHVNFSVDCDVLVGVVPLPVQSQVHAKLQSALADWLTKEMLDPKFMTFAVPSLRPKHDLSDKDIEQAILDAHAEYFRRRFKS